MSASRTWRDVVDSVIEQGECDFVNDVAGALPSYVIAGLLGIPLEDGRRLYELTEITNTGTVGDFNARAAEAGMQIFAYAAKCQAQRHNGWRHVWRCHCGAVTYGPPLGDGCNFLDGPARVR